MEATSAQGHAVQLAVRSRGAHLISWRTGGVDRLWMSPLSSWDQADAMRGGVPVLFPQFGTFGQLPKHGFARTEVWAPVPVTAPPGAVAVALELADSEATRAVWPHPFHLRLVITATSSQLDMALAVHNTGTAAMAFTGGLHTYLAVGDAEDWIEGLAGGRAWDGASVDQPRFSEPLGEHVRALDTQDRVIEGTTGPLVLHDAVLGDLEVSGDGFPHRVVWNPGPGNGLPDVVPGDEARFVCIEAAVVTPVQVDPGGTWRGSQRLRVLA